MDYAINDFGEARLTCERKGFKRNVTCFGTIQAIEKKFILFKDNDGYLYLADRLSFQFEKQIFENKLK